MTRPVRHFLGPGRQAAAGQTLAGGSIPARSRVGPDMPSCTGSGRTRVPRASRDWLRRFGFAWILTAAVVSEAAPRVTWHHDRSPYRAEFEIASQPNHPDAGVAVAVPVCGLGLEDGSDLIAFDASGAQLQLLTLGVGTENRALALVRPGQATEQVFVYFGTGARSPQAKRAVVPTLTVDIRTLPEGPFDNWQQTEQLLRKSERLALQCLDEISLGYNPVDASDAFIMVFDGYLNVPQAGDQALMIVTDDAGFLFVDGKLVLERGGRQWAATAQRGECRQTVSLKGGAVPFRLVVVEAGGGQMALLARWVNEKDKYPLRPQDFVLAGKTKLVKVEPRHSDSPCPAFWYKHASYMGYKGAQYTEVEFGTYGKGAAEWRFSDGAVLKGETVKRVFPGLSTRKLVVEQKRAEAHGCVAFPETVPAARSMESGEDFKYYTALILNQNLADVDVSTLRGYITFLTYEELNEDAIPVYEAIAGKSSAGRKELTDALCGLARCAAKSFPDKAAKAYGALFREAKGKDAEAGYANLAREYADFLLYRKRDPAAAGGVIEKAGDVLAKSDKSLLLMRLHLALQKGEAEAARSVLDALVGRRDVGTNQRYAAVKGSALHQRFEELLGEGFIDDAREVLREWEALAADDLADGTLALARAHLWQKLGWSDGALGELDGAILLNPLLPNLPDVEFERGWICLKAGDKKKADEILNRVVKEYPNHPVAARARGFLQ